MRVFLLLMLSIFLGVASASDIVGSVEKVKGSVKVKNEASIRKSRVKAGLEIKAGDIITTSKNAFAKIKLKDGSQLVLNENSSIAFSSIVNIEQKSGKIYYKISSRDAKNSLKVKTPFAIIGIKGTTFIINATKGDASLALKEGLVGVQSIKEEFELYRREVQKEFENFMSQQQAAYEEYKQVQKPGFVEKTKEFDLHQQNTVSFDGNKASEKEWTKEDDEEFKYFEELMTSMK